MRNREAVDTEDQKQAVTVDTPPNKLSEEFLANFIDFIEAFLLNKKKVPNP